MQKTNWLPYSRIKQKTRLICGEPRRKRYGKPHSFCTAFNRLEVGDQGMSQVCRHAERRKITSMDATERSYRKRTVKCGSTYLKK